MMEDHGLGKAIEMIPIYDTYFDKRHLASVNANSFVSFFSNRNTEKISRMSYPSYVSGGVIYG